MLQLRHKRLVKLLSREATIKTNPPGIIQNGGPFYRLPVMKFVEKYSGPQIDSQGRGLFYDQESFERAFNILTWVTVTAILTNPLTFTFNCGIDCKNENVIQ